MQVVNLCLPSFPTCKSLDEQKPYWLIYAILVRTVVPSFPVILLVNLVHQPSPSHYDSTLGLNI